MNAEHLHASYTPPRPHFTQGRVRRRRSDRESHRASVCQPSDSAEVCFCFNKVLVHTVPQLSRCGSSDVSAALEPSAPFTSTLIPGEHVCWNSPPIKTGIRQVCCGNRVWETRGSGPLSFPHRHSASFSLALVHAASSLLPLSPLLEPFSHLLSHYMLCFSFIFPQENLDCCLVQPAE